MEAACAYELNFIFERFGSFCVLTTIHIATAAHKWWFFMSACSWLFAFNKIFKKSKNAFFSRIRKNARLANSSKILQEGQKYARKMYGVAMFV